MLSENDSSAVRSSTSDSTLSDIYANVPPDVPQHATRKHLNLSDYLPIGCLTIGSDGWLSVSDEWRETSEISSAMPKENQVLWKLLRILLPHGWIRLHTRKHAVLKDLIALRIYVLPDDVGRRLVVRSDKKLRKALRDLTKLLDVSASAWDGFGSMEAVTTLYTPDASINDSLFYTFNTLSSPSPDCSKITDSFARDAADMLIHYPSHIAGLKTSLYPYQLRSAAMMILREVQPTRILDPRLDSCKGPTGQVFYFDQEATVFLKEKREYDEARGGILAETMGHGKTLICLATILVTKGHWPQVPPEYSLGLQPIRPAVGSLFEMAAAAAGRLQVPWKAYFEALLQDGEDYENCVKALAENTGSYTIADPEPKSSRRSSTVSKGEKIQLCSATLIIVPQNLVAQWQAEIDRHLEPNSLSILVLDSFDQKVPVTSELQKYDIILMHRPRFEREFASNQMSMQRRRSSGDCGCKSDSCRCTPSEPYRSPLRDLHFLRLIVDEGHNFATGAKSSAIHVLQMLHVERRWIVSGTPAEGLLGVEVGIAATETSHDGLGNMSLSREESLAARKPSVASPQERKDLEKLGYIVTDFLALKPWSIPQTHEDYASWHDYVVGSKGGQRKVKSLKNTLESLVVRHRIEDIEADLCLPPLHNRVIRLSPCYFDKLSVNLFLMALTANAVTSEREDQDYMFHPRNRKSLDILIKNLRQSGFYWTEHSAAEVYQTIRVSRGYLEKANSNLSERDRTLLEQAIQVGMHALESPMWRSFSQLKEMGLFVDGFPEDAQETWTLTTPRSDCPLVVGATQVGLAQKFIREHLYASDPAAGLPKAGEFAMRGARANAEKKVANLDNSGSNSGSPRPRPMKNKRKYSQMDTNLDKPSTVEAPVEHQKLTPNRLKSALKASTNALSGIPQDSPLKQTQLSGTASAKLSYLIDRVRDLHHAEKILIFYEGDYIAYCIAQALEIVGISHLIYSSGIMTDRRNAYMTTFNTTETFRVMIMDLRQAARGLHIACASRVFFVNPVWQPNIEAQAIKRAHRIGQTRPVYVETLVLKDTLEDQMLQRRQAMTGQEHEKAQRSLLDDSRMSNIIKNAGFIPISDQETQICRKQVALLVNPQPLFEQLGGMSEIHDPNANIILPNASTDYGLNVRRVKRTAEFAFGPQAEGSATGEESIPTKKRKSGPVGHEEDGDCIIVATEAPRGKPKKSARFAIP